LKLNIVLLTRNLVFDKIFYFEYPNTFQVEVDAVQYFSFTNVTLRYDSCSVYLNPGEEANCIITVKPLNK
jgi:hypothetical protein